MRKFYALISMLAIGISSLTAGVTLKEFNPKSIRQVDLTEFGVKQDAQRNQNAAVAQKAPVAAADEETWTDFGTAKFHDGWVMPAFGVTPDIFSWDVPVKKSSRGEIYKLVDPYHQSGLTLLFEAAKIAFPFTNKAYDIVIDCTNPDLVKMDYQPGVQFKAGYLDRMLPVLISFNTMYTLLEANGISGSELAGCGYISTLYGNIITLKGACVGQGTQTVDQAGSRFRYETYNTIIELPGAKDFALEAYVTEDCMHQGANTVEFKKGADVTTVKYSLYEGDRLNTSDLNFDALESQDMLTAIDASAANFKVTSSYEQTGLVSVLVAGYDAAGRRVAQTMSLYIQHADDADQWKNIGEGTFTEDLIGIMYTDNSQVQNPTPWGVTTYKVNVQENKTTKGLYRIVNPYRGAWPHASKNKHESSHDYYLTIDATNPNQVYIPYSFVGFDAGEDLGCDYLISANDFDSKPNAALWGKLKDGVITLPAESVYDFTIVDSTPASTCDGKFKLVLPTGSGIEGVMGDGDADAPVEYFNLQGQRILNPAAGQLVIRRQGGDVTKMIVR
jgi:hypothetical protein